MRFGSPIPSMSTRLLLAAIAVLLIVRLPSLVQPMGSDQGLYAYVGDRILHGELAYRDAWDQKPPGIHYIYAGLRAIAQRDMVVPGAGSTRWPGARSSSKRCAMRATMSLSSTSAWPAPMQLR